MSQIHDLFQGTLEKTQAWLEDLEVALDCDARTAHLALRSTLHALRDRCLPTEASQLGAQLPTLIRGIYYEGWHLAGTPRKERHAEQFLAHVEKDMRADVRDVDAERIVRAVFALLTERISPGEIEDLRNTLPEDIRKLWP